MSEIIELGFSSNVEVLQQLVDLKDKCVIDAGCGSMIFTRILTELGARVLAIDPDPVQAELNRNGCLLYTSPSPRDGLLSRMPSSA